MCRCDSRLDRMKVCLFPDPWYLVQGHKGPAWATRKSLAQVAQVHGPSGKGGPTLPTVPVASQFTKLNCVNTVHPVSGCHPLPMRLTSCDLHFDWSEGMQCLISSRTSVQRSVVLWRTSSCSVYHTCGRLCPRLACMIRLVKSSPAAGVSGAYGHPYKNTYYSMNDLALSLSCILCRS